MILCVECHVQWHQNKRNILPLKRWTFIFLGRSFLLHIAWDPLNCLNRTFFALTCVRTFDFLCSQVPYHIKSWFYFACISCTKKYPSLFFFSSSWVDMEVLLRYKTRPLYQLHETLPHPSLLGPFLTLPYHIPKYKILLVCCCFVKEENFRTLVRTVGSKARQSLTSSLCFMCTYARQGEAYACRGTAAGVENVVLLFIRLGISCCYQLLSLHLCLLLLMSSRRLQVWNTCADLIWVSHMAYNSKVRFKRSLHLCPSVNKWCTSDGLGSLLFFFGRGRQKSWGENVTWKSSVRLIWVVHSFKEVGQ